MSARFNGTTSKLQLPYALVSAMPITFACFFKPSGVTLTETLMEISKSSGAGGEDSYSMKAAGAVANDPVRTFRSNLGTAQAADTASPGFIAGKWNHACSIYSAASLETSLINALRAATGSTSITPASLDLTSIGCHASGAANQFYTNLIAEVVFYNCALTRSEALALASGVKPSEIRPECILAYLPLKDDIRDYSRLNNIFVNTAVVINSDHPPMIENYRRRRVGVTSSGAAINVVVGVLTFVGSAAAQAGKSASTVVGVLLLAGSALAQAGKSVSVAIGHLTLTGFANASIGTQAIITVGVLLLAGAAIGARYGMSAVGQGILRLVSTVTATDAAGGVGAMIQGLLALLGVG